MSRLFGWDLPPGCTMREIEAQCEERPCDMCGEYPDECVCPVCPSCHSQGDASCYILHKLHMPWRIRWRLLSRQLVCYVWFTGWWDWSLGVHVCWTAPNVELHLPCCFVRVGFASAPLVAYIDDASPRRGVGWDAGRWL